VSDFDHRCEFALPASEGRFVLFAGAFKADGSEDYGSDRMCGAPAHFYIVTGNKTHWLCAEHYDLGVKLNFINPDGAFDE